MEEIKERLETELNHTMNRIRQMGGAVVLEEFPAAIGDNTPLADEVDVIRQNEDREMSFATRSLLVGRANKLAEALQRLRGGEYGLCEECGEPIAPARLRALPEVPPACGARTGSSACRTACSSRAAASRARSRTRTDRDPPHYRPSLVRTRLGRAVMIPSTSHALNRSRLPGSSPVLT
jgi:RNA polymerase-binding transcription factor DksA